MTSVYEFLRLPSTVACRHPTRVTCSVVKEEEVITCCAMSVPVKPASRSFVLEYIGDTGAGRHIASEEALVALGWPAALIRSIQGSSSQVVKFETGNGSVECKLSIGISSPTLGDGELYLLPKSPIAISLGAKVVQANRPFIWIHPDLPWHCTNPSKLRVVCPMRYRQYASYVKQHVPYFKEEVTVGPRVVAPNALHYFCLLYTSPSPRD